MPLRLVYRGRTTVPVEVEGITPDRVRSLRLDEVEKLFIAETLKQTGGNREAAAEMLGIGERTLYRKIKEYQL